MDPVVAVIGRVALFGEESDEFLYPISVAVRWIESRSGACPCLKLSTPVSDGFSQCA